MVSLEERKERARVFEVKTHRKRANQPDAIISKDNKLLDDSFEQYESLLREEQKKNESELRNSNSNNNLLYNRFSYSKRQSDLRQLEAKFSHTIRKRASIDQLDFVNKYKSAKYELYIQIIFNNNFH